MHTTATPWKRLGQYFLDLLLGIVTLGIGWIIWSLIVYKDGQTPAMQILKLRVYDVTTGNAVRWRHMFLRQVLVPSAISIALSIISSATVSLGGLTGGAAASVLYILSATWQVVDGLWIFKDGANHRLTDLIVKTDVVDESVHVSA